MTEQHSTAEKKVWDLPTRIFHWTLAAFVITAILTGSDRGITFRIHTYLGYAIMVLILYRLAWGFLGGEYARFASFVQSGPAVRDYLKAVAKLSPPPYAGHNPAGGWMIILMLAVLVAICITGMVAAVAEGATVPFFADMTRRDARPFKELHESPRQRHDRADRDPPAGGPGGLVAHQGQPDPRHDHRTEAGPHSTAGRPSREHRDGAMASHPGIGVWRLHGGQHPLPLASSPRQLGDPGPLPSQDYLPVSQSGLGFGEAPAALPARAPLRFAAPESSLSRSPCRTVLSARREAPKNTERRRSGARLREQLSDSIPRPPSSRWLKPQLFSGGIRRKIKGPRGQGADRRPWNRRTEKKAQWQSNCGINFVSDYQNDRRLGCGEPDGPPLWA
jgi:cytochrome b